MKNKHFPLLAASVLGLVCATNSFASMTTTVTTVMQVTLTQNTHKYSGANGGGEFNAVTQTATQKVTTTKDWRGNVETTSVKTTPIQTTGNFQTFCIDTSHQFQSGGTYDYTISQQTYGSPDKSYSGNYISIGTAWLYSQFLDHTLTGYDYTAGAGEESSATLLQNTLWALEGEISNISSILKTSNKFYNDLIAQFGTIGNAEKDAGKDNIYGVAVMNLYDPKTGALAQSQLVRCYTPPVVSVPEPSTIVAGALLLLPLGVSALKVLRRKQATVN